MRRVSLAMLVACMAIWPCVGQAATTADVVFLVDESGSMGGEHAWLGGMISSLESGFVGAGVTGNRYGLVGFGGYYSPHPQNPHKETVGTGDWGTATDFAAAAANLVTSGATEDGWAALNFALTNYTFRNNAAVNFVLVTDEDRDNTNGSLSFAGLETELGRINALLNVVVNANFKDGANATALGIDDAGNAYKADGSGGFTTATGGYVSYAYGNTLSTYINLAHASGGAAWDLNQLRLGGNTATSFTKAFIDIKVDEVTNQPPSNVPEPATLAIWSGLAGLGLIGSRRRRKTAA